ncbi:MAG: hypothetical protein JWO52_5589 [Gammaproteobacteria bacterium]|nr:hypothetical protein [Gammaproteobacteria bacterium]
MSQDTLFEQRGPVYPRAGTLEDRRVMSDGVTDKSTHSPPLLSGDCASNFFAAMAPARPRSTGRSCQRSRARSRAPTTSSVDITSANNAHMLFRVALCSASLSAAFESLTKITL